MSNEIKTNKGAIVKEINGVKYFKLVSPYEGDYTKNCSLLGSEMDENFFFLRSYDIQDMQVDENRNLILTRVDGDTLMVNISEEIGYPTFEFIKEEGKIIVHYPDGTTDEMDGFLIEGQDIKVATDYTIKGDGRIANPLRISEVERTGTYSPAKRFLDLTDSGNTMPEGDKCGKGYRIVTKEYLTPFGLLYDYSGVELIQSALTETGSPWRVPSREDWADMLNAAEYCPEDRNHDTLEINEWTGNWAGARAKSISSWSASTETEGGYPVAGIDNLPSTGSYGTFHVIPIGYGEGSRGPLTKPADRHWKDIEAMRLLSSFWTLTPTGSRFKSNTPNIYTRTFAYDTRKVLQESSKPSSRLSLRLVKDFDFDSFNEYENILGHSVPCVLISNPELNYSKIWTSINIGFSEGQYSGVSSHWWEKLENEEDRQVKEVFYINEWNGIEWVKKPMQPGDSVVILDYDGSGETSGDTYHEWRVYQNEDGTVELIDTIEALKKEIQEEIDEINERVDELSAVTEAEISRAISAETVLAEAIENESERAISAETILQNEIDGLKIVEVEPNSTTAQTAYQLQDIDGNVKGDTIFIPHDKAIKEMVIGWSGATFNERTGELDLPTSGDTEVLYVVYHNDIGEFSLLIVDLEDFIHETEFKDGLVVNNHEVRVKIDENSEVFLTVGPDGVKLSGVQDAIDEERDRAISAETVLAEAIETETERAISAETVLAEAIETETERAISAETELHDDIVAETERAISAETALAEAIEELSGSSSGLEEKLNKEIERSKFIDDNIAIDIIGCLGDSESGYTIDFFDAYWEDSTQEEWSAHTEDHSHIQEGEPLPNPSGWTGGTYIEWHNPETHRDEYYKLASSNNYISDSKTVSEAIKALDSSLKNEENERKEEVSELNEKLNNEIERAEAAEEAISSAVNEFSASTVQELENLNNKIEEEENRAVSAETVLQENIDEEKRRAEAVEEAISSAVNEFSASTVQELENLNNKIDNEIERAEAAEDAISSAVNEFSASTVQELERLDGQDISVDGHEASVLDGITLKRNNGEYIKINIETNFGLLPSYD